MPDFVLIHGGAHGAWCWQTVIDELERLGQRGFAFDLPGHGADPTPRSTVTFESYVSATNRFLESGDFEDVVLVGHSIAGMLLPEVAQANRERIRQVVFVAAVVLDAGEATIDLIPESRRPSYFEMAAQTPDNTLRVDFETAHARFFNDLPAAEARRYFEKLTPQPFAPYLAPARVSAGAIQAERRFILCTHDKTFPPDQCLTLAAKLGGTLERIESDHDVMLSHPQELARLLVKGVNANAV